MSPPLRLEEYQPWVGELSASDGEFISAELPKFGSERLFGGGWRVNPRQYVGVMTLPSGTRLEIAPKLPVRSVFYMLATASGLPSPFREEVAEYESFEELLEFVAAYFAGLVEDRVREGLYRAYVEEEANLPLLRGRIAFAEDVRANYVLRHRTYCRFAELGWDVADNQVLRQTVQLLARWGFEERLRRRLAALDTVLDEVTPGRFVSADMDRLAYHRLNAGYQPMHALCRLFLEGASLSEAEGPYRFPCFVLDMNQLFERFVTEVLREARPAGARLTAQAPLWLGLGQKVFMKADLRLRVGSGELIADCKYKVAEEGEYIHHDYYQVLAYCTAAGSYRGALLYPRDELPVDDVIHVQHSEVEIRQLGVRLDLSLDGLKQELGRFAAEVWSLATQ